MFFQGKLKQVRRRLPNCQQCGASANCRYGKQTSPYKGEQRTVFVVDTPASDSPDALLRGRYGEIGRYLSRLGRNLSSFPVVPAASCPGADDWKHCQPMMIAELQRLNPTVIIPVGKMAVASVVQWLWGKSAETLDKWYGFQIPSRTINAWVCPIGRIGNRRNMEVADMWAYRHLQLALKLNRRPYDEVPDYAPRILYSRSEILGAIEEASKHSLTAFDYETTGLKPEASAHQIVSCSISWLDGDTPHAVAFMVDESLHDALRGYLTGPSKKIAANAKFETRWTRAKLGVEVKNWAWDTMLGAHWEDPRPEITGLKFQAFTRLGVPFFAGDTEQHFNSVGATETNNIHKIPVHQLLKYNGIDALAELDLGILQMRENGITEKWNSKNLPLT